MEQQHKLLDPRQVLERMNRLAEVLASGNVTFGNLELGRHIDRIAAYPDGHVVMRTNKLGVFEGASVLLSRSTRRQPNRRSGRRSRSCRVVEVA